MTDAATPAVSRGLLVGLGVVVALGLVVIAAIVLLGPDAGDEEPVVEPEPPEPEAPLPDLDASEDSLTADDVVAARDPFQQLVQEPAGGAPTPPTAPSPTPPPTLSPTPAPTLSPAPSPTPTPSPTPSPSPDEREEVDGATVRLIEVYSGQQGEPRAIVTVDENGYDVAEGETFAGRFELLDVSGRCATIRRDTSRFVLCEGDQVHK